MQSHLLTRNTGLRRLFLTTALAGLAVIASAETAPLNAAEITKVRSIEGVTQYALDNGLKILLYADNSKPTVTINLTIHVGSRHEGYGETGMAHLLEHMVFKGTPLHGNIPKSLSDRGASFNGTTSFDRTNYYETLPANDDNLEFAIRLEADRMVNSFIKGEDLATEMTVVRNEFERGENSPSRVLQQRMMGTAFEWHNYGKSTIGNRSDIERVPIPRLRAFYRKFYQPDIATLIVAGKFTEKTALEFIAKYFGAIERPERELELTYTEEPAQDGERLVTLQRSGDLGLVSVIYHIPSAPDDDFAAMDTIGSILAIEPAGRLYKTTVEAKKAAGIIGGTYALHDPGVMIMTCRVKDLKNMADVRATMIQEIERLGTEGVTDEEVARVQKQIVRKYENTLTSSTAVASELSEWEGRGDWRMFFLYRDQMAKVTAADVKRVAAKYLMASNRTVGLFEPTKEAQRVAIAPRTDLQEMLKDYRGRAVAEAGEAFDPTPANVQKRLISYTLDGGIKVGLLPKKTRGNTVALSLSLHFGSLKTLEGKNMAAALMGTMMARGTKTFDYQQIQDKLDALSSTLSGSSALGSASFGGTTKREQLPEVLQLLKGMLREPTFPAKEFDVIKQERLAALQGALSDPMSKAQRRLYGLLYPYSQSDPRFRTTAEDAVARYTNLKLEEVVDLYRQFLGNHAGELVLVGDFDPDVIRPLLADIFAGWTVKEPYEEIHAQTFTKTKAVRQQILTPDKKNAVYFSGHTIPIGFRHQDYAALKMASQVFGAGSLSSRLGERIRGKEGLSYGIRSSYSAFTEEENSRFTVMAIANPMNTPRVVELVDEELGRLIKDGVTAKELAAAQQSYVQGFSLQFNNDGRLASLIADMMEQGDTVLFYDDLFNRVKAVTQEEINAAIKRHLLPGKLIVVTAGDLK